MGPIEMSEAFQFHMGEYRASIPRDFRYSHNHMWLQGDSHVRKMGFTDYAVRLLQDVYFLEWVVDVDQKLVKNQQIGMIESSKAEADLYAPFSGKVYVFNDQLMDDPSSVNVDTYGKGWLFELESTFDSSLSADAYLGYLEENWEETQRKIKGQYN